VVVLQQLLCSGPYTIPFVDKNLLRTVNIRIYARRIPDTQ
jgi:hypothetical protein